MKRNLDFVELSPSKLELRERSATKKAERSFIHFETKRPARRILLTNDR
jgi:hypothetical protein